MGKPAANLLLILIVVIVGLFAIKMGKELAVPTSVAPTTNSSSQSSGQQPTTNQQQGMTQPGNATVPSGNTSIGEPSSGSAAEAASTEHTYYWMSGDIKGEHATCYFAISQPDQPLDIQPVGVVATGSFVASSQADFQQQKQALQQAAAHGSVSGRCDDY